MNVPSADRLVRWEDRALLGGFLFGAANAAYALEQPLLGVLGLLGLLLAPLLGVLRAKSSSVSDALVLGLTLVGAIPLGIAAREPAPALALFLVAAQGLKFFSARSERDKATSCVVGIVLAAVAAAEAVEPVIIPLQLGSLGFTLAFGLVRNLRLHGAGEGGQGPRWTGAALSARGLLAIAGWSVVVAVLTAAFFFACPRVGAKFLANTRASSTDRLAGFSDTVGLDAIGRIKQNDRIAFRVVTPAPEALGDAPYWRGRVLDTYEGKRWRSSRMFALTRRPYVLDSRMVFRDRRVVAARGMEPVRMTFYVEPLGTRCLLTAGNPQRITFKSTRPKRLVRDDLGSVLMDRSYLTSMAYELETYVDGSASKTLLGDARQSVMRRACLLVPPDVDAQRLRGYASRALRDQRLKADAGALRVATALARHLQRYYTYTLDVQTIGGGEPVQEFLYERRRGHCELFASAHVLLLRASGIPARLVTGFRGGEWSEWSGSYTVRQRDAHAWVEALTEYGWTTFDPTPADASAAAGASLVESLGSFVNWLELRWFSLVIAFDAYDQRNFLFKLRERFAERFGFDPVDASVEARAFTSAALGALVLLGGLGVFVLRRRLRAPSQALLPADRPTDVDLAALLAALDARGLRLRPAETPLELAGRAGDALGLGGRIDDWVRGYYARRFGEAGAGPRESGGLRDLLAALEPGRDASGPV